MLLGEAGEEDGGGRWGMTGFDGWKRHAVWTVGMVRVVVRDGGVGDGMGEEGWVLG